jgi:uncharacterized membrane protein YdbT with pleckstrin-like domain
MKTMSFDEGEIRYQGFDDDRRHSLGHRAFYFFLSERLKLMIAVVVVVGLMWYGMQFVPTDYAVWANYTADIATLIGVALLVSIVFRSFLEYRYYTYTFTDEAFIMTYGVMLRKEVAAPYHQIQNVVVQHTVLNRAMGVCQISIFLAGADKEASQMKVVLPAVGRKKAKLVQKELLVRMKHKANA